MSFSTQSQEAIASIDAELTAILKRSTSVKSLLKESSDAVTETSRGNSESESEIHTDSGEDYDPKESAKNKKKPTKQPKPKKSPRKRSAVDAGDAPAPKSQKTKQLTVSSSTTESVNSFTLNYLNSFLGG